LEEDGWKPYSFSRKHPNFKHPNEFDPAEDEELAANLKNGLAFWLSYYEHGLCRWSLSGEGPTCRWDSRQRAGILVWEQDEGDIGAKSYEERAEDARAAVKVFTEWCNGEVYAFGILEPCESCGCSCNGDVVESGGGYIGEDGVTQMFEMIRSHLGEGDTVKKFIGESRWLADDCWTEEATA
jgi:hypothetical protein